MEDGRILQGKRQEAWVEAGIGSNVIVNPDGVQLFRIRSDLFTARGQPPRHEEHLLRVLMDAC
jgi:hypothetical protein